MTRLIKFLFGTALVILSLPFALVYLLWRIGRSVAVDVSTWLAP